MQQDMDSKHNASAPTPPCKLLLTRLLFHGLLLMMYPLIAIYSFSFLNTWSLISLGQFLTVVVLLLRTGLNLSDYTAIRRRIPSLIYFLLDFFLVGGLLTSQIFVPGQSYSIRIGSGGENTLSEWQQTLSFSHVGFFIFIFPLIFYCPYILFLFIGSIVNRMRYGRAFDPFFAIYPGSTNSLTVNKTPSEALVVRWFLGLPREEIERNEIQRHCTDVVFGRTMFRKHPFEPIALALVRGFLATYAVLGVLGYGALLINTAMNTSAAAISIQRSLVGTNSVRGTYLFVWSDFSNLWPETFVILADPGGEFNDLNITSSLDDPPANSTAKCQSISQSVLYGQSCALAPVFNVDTIYINVTTNVSLSMWMIRTIDSTEQLKMSQLAPAVEFADPFRLYPNTHLLATLYPTQRVQDTNQWLTFSVHDIRTDNSESSNPGTSSLILSTVLPASQQWIPSEEIIAPSVVTVALGIIANVGGAFVAVSGVFSVIFGRKIWEVVAGGRPVSPFGLFGYLPAYKRAIHKQYPRLQEDVDQGGMASFIGEVAMDTGIVIQRRTWPVDHDAQISANREGLVQYHNREDSEMELLPRISPSY